MVFFTKFEYPHSVDPWGGGCSRLGLINAQRRPCRSPARAICENEARARSHTPIDRVGRCGAPVVVFFAHTQTLMLPQEG